MPSNNTRLVIVSLSDCNQISKLLSGHNLYNSKSFIVLYLRYFFIKLFGTVVEINSAWHIHLSLRENRRFSWQSRKYMCGSGLLRHCVPRNDETPSETRLQKYRKGWRERCWNKILHNRLITFKVFCFKIKTLYYLL